MTLRVDYASRRVIVRLHQGEEVFKVLGKSTFFSLPGITQKVGIGIEEGDGLTLEIQRAPVGRAPGWSVVKGGAR